MADTIIVAAGGSQKLIVWTGRPSLVASHQQRKYRDRVNNRYPRASRVFGQTSSLTREMRLKSNFQRSLGFVEFESGCECEEKRAYRASPRTHSCICWSSEH